MEKSCAVIYLHGFNGNPSIQIKQFQRGNFVFYAPNYCPSNVSHTKNFLNPYIKAVIQKHTTTILFGNSLGGMWADYFARLFRIPVILNNPATVMKGTLSKFIGVAVKMPDNSLAVLCENDIELLTKVSQERSQISPVNTVVFLNQDDEIVPFELAHSEYSLNESTKIIIHKDGGHRLIRKKEVIQEIEKMCN